MIGLIPIKRHQPILPMVETKFTGWNVSLGPFLPTHCTSQTTNTGVSFSFAVSPEMTISPFQSHRPSVLRVGSRSDTPPGHSEPRKSRRAAPAEVGHWSHRSRSALWDCRAEASGTQKAALTLNVRFCTVVVIVHSWWFKASCKTFTRFHS